MKTLEIKLNPTEFNRYVDWVSNGFMKVVRPFIFHGEDGEFYCLHHGVKEGGLLGTTTKDVRKYAEEHSNIANKKLNIICCFGAGVVEETDNVKVSIKSEYPILIGAENSSAVFGILESDEEIPMLIETMKTAGITLTKNDCKLEKRNV